MLVKNKKQHTISLNDYDPKTQFVVYRFISSFNHKDQHSQIMELKFEDHSKEFEKKTTQKEDLDERPPPPPPSYH